MRSSRTTNRRGLAVIWLVVTLPVVLLLLCFCIEIGNLWLARTELENGLESAALAGLEHWNTTTQDSANARTFAKEFAERNTVVGSPLVLTDANVLLGTVPPDEFGPFSDGTVPSCVVPITEFEIEITVDSTDTLGDPDAFQFKFTNVVPSTYSLTKLTIDVRNDNADNGSFHPGPVMAPFTEASGYGPVLGGSTEVLWNAVPLFSGPGSSVMEANFNLGEWRSTNFDATKDLLVFGVDTDDVREDGPTDKGGDFGEGPPPPINDPLGRIRFTFELSDGNSTQVAIFEGALFSIGSGNKAFQIGNTLPIAPPPPLADAAVRVQVTNRPVPAICLPGYTFYVSGRATATSSCSNPEFRLIPNRD